jgi:UMF1 family MFS transporter
MRRLYPLRGLPRQSQLWSWISFDVANQSFTLIINTLLFSIFFGEVVVQNPATDDRWWAITYGVSMVLCALLSPIAGAMADQRAWKKECLIATGLLCALLTCALAFVKPGQLWLAMLLYIPANLFFSLGENFLASFLPGLARSDQVGRVSGFSWAVAYSSALVLLALTAAAMKLFGLESPNAWRPFFVFAGVWFLVFTIPTMLLLKEPELAERPKEQGTIVGAAFRRLGESVRRTSEFRDLATLLVASLFYGTGMTVVIFFASKLASEYGFDKARLVYFVAVITVSGIVGTFIPTLFQDRIGHRRSTVIFLAVWIFATVGFAGYAFMRERYLAANPGATYPIWPVWLVGNLLGFGLGSLGSANRAFVSFLAPPSRSAEVFGVWGLVFKLAAVLTFPFAWVKDTMGTPSALLVLAGFLVLGMVLTFFVDERRGRAAAAESTPEPQGPTPTLQA